MGINIPLLREAAHAIRLFPLVSQRPISVSIQLRWLYHFRVRQDRDSALQQAPDADWTKMVDERWRGSAWLEHLRKTLLSPPLKSSWRERSDTARIMGDYAA